MNVDISKYTVVRVDDDSGEPYRKVSEHDTYEDALESIGAHWSPDVQDLDMLHNGRFCSWIIKG